MLIEEGLLHLDMANLSGQRQAQEIDRLANLESAGQRRRGACSTRFGYWLSADFLRQQAFPREQLNLYSGLVKRCSCRAGTILGCVW